MEDKETYVCLASKDGYYVAYSHVKKENEGFTDKWFSKNAGRMKLDLTQVIVI